MLRLRLHRSLGCGLVFDGAADALPRRWRRICARVSSIRSRPRIPRRASTTTTPRSSKRESISQEHPEEYEGVSLTQIRDAFKTKGSVAHDLGAMPKGHPLRNVSDYAWYNNNYWVDLFPKLAMRVLRNVKFTGDIGFPEEELGDAQIRPGIPAQTRFRRRRRTRRLSRRGEEHLRQPGPLRRRRLRRHAVPRRLPGDDQDGGHDRTTRPARRASRQAFDKGWNSLEKLWRDGKNKKGEKLQYYITCFDPETGKTNTDVWTNQLDALWYLIAIGEEPFIPEDRVRKILKTIYRNNRAFMGWAMCKTENGKPVESDQGQGRLHDLQLRLRPASGLLRHGQGEQRRLQAHGPGRLRLRQFHDHPGQPPGRAGKGSGRIRAGPHYIVAAYPRPGAVWTHLV